MVLRGECLRLDGGELPYAPLAAALRDAPPERARRGARASSGPRCAPSSSARSRSSARAAGRRRSEPTGSPRRGVYEALISCSACLGRPRAGAARARGPALGGPLDARVRALPRARAARERVAVAMTFRTGELSADHPVREMLAELQYHDRVDARRARPAGPRGRRARSSRASSARRRRRLVDEVHERCGGNPLFAEELLSARLSETGGELPARLADALRVRLRRVLRAGAPAAALRGRDRPPGAAGPARRRRGRGRAGAVGARCATRVDHHLLVHRGDGTFAFRHDVMREAVYADLLPRRAGGRPRRGRRARWASGARSAELAFHWRAAGRDAEALRASVAAGLEAEDARAFGEALRHFAPRSSLGRGRHGPAAGPRRAARPRLRPARATRASTTRPSPGARRRCGCSTAAPTPRAPRASSSGSAACRRSPATAGTARSPRRCGCCPHEDRAGRARLLGAEAYALWAVQPARRGARALRGGAGAVGRARRGRVRAHGARPRLRLRGDPERRRGPPAQAIGALELLERPERPALRAPLPGRGAAPARRASPTRSRSPRTGERHARRLGMEASFGRFLALNAATDEFLLGRWDAAGARLAGDRRRDDLEPWNAIARGQVAGAAAARARAARGGAGASCEAARVLCERRAGRVRPGGLRRAGRARAVARGPARRARALVRTG